MIDQFRESLSAVEKPTYDAFIGIEGRKPESMWQLMQYGSIMEKQRKEHATFWAGVFGL